MTHGIIKPMQYLTTYFCDTYMCSTLLYHVVTILIKTPLNLMFYLYCSKSLMFDGRNTLGSELTSGHEQVSLKYLPGL